MNDTTAWLKAAQREIPTVRLPSWIPSVNHETAIHEDDDCEVGCVELDEARAERDQALAALDAKKRELEALSAQLEAQRRECAALQRMAESALATAERARSETIASAEPDLIQLAAAIAERVISRELSLDPAIIVGWAHEGIAALQTREEIVIALAPDLFGSMPRERFAIEGRVIDVVLDEDLAPGCCEVRSNSGRVEENVSSRISAIVEALGSET